MINMLLPVFSAAVVPVAMMLAVSRQPNDNRSGAVMVLALMHSVYMLVCLLLPDEIYGYSYVSGMIINLACIRLLMLSESDGQWCDRVSWMLWASTVIDGAGGWLWTAYYPPTVYNVAMMITNLALLWAIMVDCDTAGRTDVSSMVGGRDTLSFLPRLGLGAAREAAK